MARRPSKHLRAARPLSAGHAASETKADGAWVVRSVPGARFEAIESGHFSATQTPELVAARLDAFLAGLGG